MKTILFIVSLLAMSFLLSCYFPDDGSHLDCVEIGLINREFDFSELSPYKYDSNGYRSELNNDIVRMIDFGLNFEVVFHDNVIVQVRDLESCSDIELQDSIIDVNIYLKTSDDFIDVSESFRNFGAGTRQLSNLFLHDGYLDRNHTFNLDLVNYSEIPDTAVFVSELVFSTGEVDQNETDTLFFY